MSWTKAQSWLRKSRIPIIADLCSSSADNWREAFKEVFVILLFSLMPMWLGVLVVTISTVADKTFNFLDKFASSSDLGILSASLLGPLLYMMFRDDGRQGTDRVMPRFPSGLWFTAIIFVCCVVAAVNYSLTYLSGTHTYFDEHGGALSLVEPWIIGLFSWALFCVSIVIVVFASTLRNSSENRAPAMMREDTADFVAGYQAAQDDDQ